GKRIAGHHATNRSPAPNKPRRTLPAPHKGEGSIQYEQEERHIRDVVNGLQRTDDAVRQRERFSPRSLHDPKSEYFAEDRAEGRETVHDQKHCPEDRNSSGKREPAGGKEFPDVPGERDHEKCGWHERYPKPNRICLHGRRPHHSQLSNRVPCRPKSREGEEQMRDLRTPLSPDREVD